MELNSPNYNQQRWFHYNEFRISNKLCDGYVVSCDGRHFPVHRVILFIRNDFFRDLLVRDEDNGSTEWRHEMPLEGDIVEVLLDHIYTETGSLTVERLIQFYQASVEFRVPSLRSHCLSFLKAELDPTNVTYFMRESEVRYLAEVKDVCLDYILNNFRRLPDVIRRQLSAADFRQVIASDRVNIRSEEELFEMVVDWVSYDARRRSGRFPELVASLRLGLIPTDHFLNHVIVHPYVIEHWPACGRAMTAARRIVINQNHGCCRQLDLGNPLIRPRIPRSVIMIVGGWSRTTPVRSMEVYDPMAGLWFFEAGKRTPFPIAYHGMAELGKKLYVFGGFDGDRYLNATSCFDPERGSWIEMARLHKCRCYVSAAVCSGAVYACGGFNGDVRMRSAEVYSPELDRWSYIADMTYIRSDASAACLNGKVYIAGGFNGRDCLDSFEVYDPEQNQWNELPRMITVRSGLCLREFRGSLYALGGFNGTERLKSVEKYDVGERRWQNVAEMLLPRSNFASVSLDDKLFVIGGYGGSSTIYDVEYFDGEQWNHVTNLNVRRSASRACVLTDIANVAEYTFHESQQ